jgi:hypothetical protein
LKISHNLHMVEYGIRASAERYRPIVSRSTFLVIQ